MRRLWIPGLSGLLGFFHPFVFTLLGSLIGTASSGYRGGAEHEAGKLLGILILWGGGLFSCVWIWIGLVVARDARKGLLMGLACVLLGGVLSIVGALWLDESVPLSAAGALAPYLFTWAALSAGSAYVAARLIDRMRC